MLLENVNETLFDPALQITVYFLHYKYSLTLS